MERHQKVTIQKLIVKPADSVEKWPFIVPVALPDFDDIRRFAFELHKKGEPYEDEYQGWPIKYSPADTNPPEEDWMLTRWASCFIGVWPLWSISFDWENGDDQPPIITIWDKNLVKPGTEVG